MRTRDRLERTVGLRLAHERRRSLGVAGVMLMLGLVASGCAALRPTPLSTDERLVALPLEGAPVERPVTVRWNAHQVPFIEAESDRDLAVALGIVHGHLRGAQIAIGKRISQGRLSEMAGPFTADIDHALRLVNYGKAAPEVERRLPPETRDWLEAFVAGLNWQQANAPRPPPEFGLLGLSVEPYTVQDLLTIGRLAGTDVNWLAYVTLLRARNTPEFPELWRRARAAGSVALASAPAAELDVETALLTDILAGSSKAGSNSVAVAASRSTTGAPLIANDPHLGFGLPNLWVLAGMRSPSFNAVGLMVPGVPILGVGRNPDLAWGGTNMRSLASELYDVSGLPAEQITVGDTRIGVRFWFDRTRPVRETPFGRIVSDSALLPAKPGEAIALRWAGHEPTDEVTALMAAARARTIEGFRASFADFGVSPQNIVVATRDGHIGHFLATTQPRRQSLPTVDIVRDARDPSTHWQGFWRTLDLPFLFDPPHGFVASANNEPELGGPPMGLFFSDDDRVRRLREILTAKPRLSVDDLVALQTDTRSPDAAILARGLMERVATAGVTEPAPFLALLRDWDGDYRIDSAAPVAFETLLFHLVPPVYGANGPGELPSVYGQWTHITAFFLRDFDALPAERRTALLRAAVTAAAADTARIPNWGEMHRLRTAHVLAAVPVLGRFFAFGDAPVGGSRETPMKTSHGFVNERHTASFGSQSRHVSDLSDPDANWFLLFGGNDGWLGSANFADQVPLWRERRYIRMPLRPETVAAEFPRLTVLRPATVRAPVAATGAPRS